MSADETTPILMEDAQQLQQERYVRVKRTVIAMTTAAVGVGLCLAIVIPLIVKGNHVEANVVGGPMLQRSLPSSAFHLDTPNSTLSEIAETEHKFPNVDNNDSWPHFGALESNDSSEPTDWEPTVSNYTCPIVPQSQRGVIDFENFDENILFEVARIQTYDTPGYGYRMSCSSVRFNTSEDEITYASASWTEGKHKHHASRIVVTVELHALDSKNDWVFNVLEPSTFAGVTGQFSILAQLSTYILGYQCYSEAQFDFNPGYVISVYSTHWQHHYDFEIVNSLFELANNWGLNVNNNEYEYIRQHRCGTYQ